MQAINPLLHETWNTFDALWHKTAIIVEAELIHNSKFMLVLTTTLHPDVT